MSEPNLIGNEKIYLNECIRSNFVSSHGKFLKKFEKKKEEKQTNKFIDGEYKDIEEDDDRKI